MTEQAQSVFVDPRPDTAPQSLVAAFRRSCELHGSRTALTDPATGTHMSYMELARAAESVAAELVALALPAHSLIALCLERTPGMVVAMLGAVLAGHAYLPLDPRYPEARLRATLDDARPAALLLTEALNMRLADLPMPRRVVSGVSLAVSSANNWRGTPGPGMALPQDDDPDALLYVIYTSGSTGAPKGVMVSHRNVLRLFQATEPWFHFSPDDVWTMFHSFAFDFSVWEMWGPLLSGGRLVLVPFEISRAPDELLRLLRRERVTVLNQTPTAFRLLDEADRSSDEAEPLALRLVIFGGEALVLRSLLPWMARHGDAHPRLVNMYGITETTVHVTYRPILRADAEREMDSLIGEPIPDLRVYLLDEQLEHVTDEQIGEIFVGGAGVALGYLGQPELTAGRFLPDRFGPLRGRTMYRTGDLARRRADGELVYMGRADRQVKINGFRIELAEVEATLLRSDAVEQLAVAVLPDEGYGPRLAAWFVPRVGGSIAELTRFAAETLPPHMRPASIHTADRLPLTLNGKLDVAALLRVPPVAAAKAPTATANSLTETVLEEWTEILGRPEISADENFFDAGGTSLQLIALRTRLQARLGRNLPMSWFFQYTTVAALASKLEAAVAAESSPASTMPTISAPAQQAAGQRAAWLAAQARRRQAR